MHPAARPHIHPRDSLRSDAFLISVPPIVLLPIPGSNTYTPTLRIFFQQSTPNTRLRPTVQRCGSPRGAIGSVFDFDGTVTLLGLPSPIGGVADWICRLDADQKVVGSSPAEDVLFLCVYGLGELLRLWLW